jgi:TonB family protein
MKELCALVLSLATLSFQQSPPNPSTDTTSWPVPGVLRPGQGVTSPVLLRETKPNYTADAMRARIQGLVVMECVVELDGSVGPVRVTRSLDQAFGLDDEAVRTVKQWRFRPGTKEGAPVRVVVMVEMSFTLGNRGDVSAPNPALNPGTTAPIAWPDGFIDARESAGAAVATWLEDSITTPLIFVRFAYPAHWSILKSTEPDRLVTLYSETPLGTRTISISDPRPSPFVLPQPLQQTALDAFALGASQTRGTAPGLRQLKAGQVLRPGGLWLWFEISASTIEPSNAPAALADRLRNAYDGMHVWTFTTSANGQSVSVFCSVLHRANSTDVDKQEDLRSAGLDFGAFLQRISIQPR